MSSTTDPRPLMVEIAHLLYSRFLTNSAGGNMSCRVGERIYITPRGLGSGGTTSTVPNFSVYSFVGVTGLPAAAKTLRCRGWAWMTPLTSGKRR